MADKISKDKRSWNMSRIHGKDTCIEIKVRKFLFANGFRFRKNDKRYPGKPDIVLPKYNTAVFIHGCFWHRHQGCKYATVPKDNFTVWQEKFEKNILNDAKHKNELEQLGWRVFIVWECEIEKDFDNTMQKLVDFMTLNG